MILHVDTLNRFDLSESADHIEIAVSTSECSSVKLCFATSDWLRLVAGVMNALKDVSDPDALGPENALH
jgi:hypothetical protein